MEKHIIVKAALPPARSSCHDVSPHRHGMISMRNMKVAASGRLAPCEKHAVLAHGLKGYTLAGAITTDAGTFAVLVASNSVAVASATQPSQPVFLPLLPSTVQCAVPTAPGELTLMTESGPFLLAAEPDGTFTVKEFHTATQPAIVVIGETTTLRYTVPRRKLSRVYERDEKVLDAVDAEKLAADLETARQAMREMAAVAGFHVDPVEYSHKVTDAHGRTVYESPVKIIAGPRGYDFLDDYDYSITGSGTASYRESFTLTATAFKFEKLWA